MSVKTKQSYATFMKCRECNAEYPLTRLAICNECFAPVDIIYDYDSISLKPFDFHNRPQNIWRYKELLPLNNNKNIIDLNVGYTPLIKCKNLGKILGLKNLYIKNDSVNPTFSFKDRPANVAVSKAIEFGDKVIGCASTGNLAGAVAAQAAKARLNCYVLTPLNTELGKLSQVAAYGANIIGVNGTYDDANRLAVLASEEFGWNIVNVTSRPYYVEGSKTMAFEILEQLNWQTPDQIIIPVASGALFCAINRGLNQFEQIGLVNNNKVKLNGAQASGCSPISTAFKNNQKNITPVEKPDTLAKSIAIGDPGDGDYVLQLSKLTNGRVDDVSDSQITEVIKLIAKSEGIFTEPAGAVTVAMAQNMVTNGQLDSDETVVCCVTGNGLKTTELIDINKNLFKISPSLDSLIDTVRGINNA